MNLDEQKAAADLAQGFELAFNYARFIAMLPIDEWLDLINRMEAIAPIADPTRFREYLYSEKPEILKKVLRACLEVKRTMEEIQPAAMREYVKANKNQA